MLASGTQEKHENRHRFICGYFFTCSTAFMASAVKYHRLLGYLLPFKNGSMSDEITLYPLLVILRGRAKLTSFAQTIYGRPVRIIQGSSVSCIASLPSSFFFSLNAM